VVPIPIDVPIDAPTNAPTDAPTDAAAGPSSSPLATGTASQADLATFARIESQVEAIRGLRPANTVTPVLLSPTALRDKLVELNAAETNHAAIADKSRLFVHLGLLPAGSSLEQLLLDLDTSEVIGFYDPVSKGLYVLSNSGGIGAVEEATFSHEYTHALQDQHFGLDKLALDAVDQGDRDLARTALPEGDATMAMTTWETKNLSLADLVSIAEDASSGPQGGLLAAAPAILRDTLYFPYTYGLAFDQAVYAEGGWAAVNKLYANPPSSTSQIMHPALYTSGVKPVAVAVPAVPAALGSGWKLTMSDTLGEAQLRIWLEEENPTSAQVTVDASATSVWGGDRVGLYEGPNGSWAVAMLTKWRTAAGSGEFRAAAKSRAVDLPGPSAVCSSGNGVALYVASDATSLKAFATC
jgi:hypothetical protein